VNITNKSAVIQVSPRSDGFKEREEPIDLFRTIFDGITNSKQNYPSQGNPFVCELGLHQHQLVQENIQIRALQTLFSQTQLHLVVNLKKRQNLSELTHTHYHKVCQFVNYKKEKINIYFF
jgi:hypothetical protein